MVGAIGGVVSDQADADDDMSVQQRLLLAGGSALNEGGDLVGELTGVQVAADALTVAGEFLILCTLYRLNVTLYRLNVTLYRLNVILDATLYLLSFIGGVVSDQAEADADTDLKDRVKMGVGKESPGPKEMITMIVSMVAGSAAEGTADLDSMRYNYEGKKLCHEIQSVAG